MNEGIDLAVAFLIGALVGMGELVGRYRDEPGRAVNSRPAYVYMAINGAASAAALGLAHIFGWTFGAAPGTDQARATQVLVAGFGAMAVFRSSLFLYRVGTKEVGIGPVAFLQVMLEATDRGVDRHRAQARSEWVRKVMDGLQFNEIAISLPAYAIGLMQNLSQQDQSVLSTRVGDVRASPQDDRMKVMSLGLLVLDAVGEEVLAEAVLTVRKELGRELPAAPASGPLAGVLSRRRTMADTTSGTSAATTPGDTPSGATSDAPSAPPPTASGNGDPGPAADPLPDIAVTPPAPATRATPPPAVPATPPTPTAAVEPTAAAPTKPPKRARSGG